MRPQTRPEFIRCSSKNFTSMHLYGDSYIVYLEESDQSFVYVRIPKNAGSWASQVFRGRSFDYINSSFKDDLPCDFDALRPAVAERKYMTLLRDPIDRWITGVCQVLGFELDNRMTIDFKQLIKNPLLHENNHIEPQISFLDGIEYKRLTAIKVDDMLTSRLYHWCELHISPFWQKVSIDQDHENSYNITRKKTAPWRKTNVRLKEFVYSSDKNINALKSAYREDYELLDNVSWWKNAR